MSHGTIADNVQFQDIVRITQRVNEFSKENGELAVSTVESHGFVETSSCNEEYKRILKLCEQNLEK